MSRFSLVETIRILEGDDVELSRNEDGVDLSRIENEVDDDIYSEKCETGNVDNEDSSGVGESMDLNTDENNNEKQIETEESVVTVVVNNHKDMNQQNRGRKRVKNTHEWIQNVRKRKRQCGGEYTDVRGLTKRARELKTVKDCQGKCKYKCATKVSANDRKEVFDDFWKMSDSEKNCFYANTTDRVVKERKRTKAEASRRTYSIQYYLVTGTDRIRVCKTFYLTTLDISAKRIEYFYSRKDGFDDKRGKHSKNKVSEEERERIRQHIRSFPKIPSHYCRSSTTKEFFEANLSVSKMYKLYVSECNENRINPLKENMYRKIFNTEFNIGFNKPKKDRCDTCEAYKVTESSKVPIHKLMYDNHILDKQNTRAERKNDRENCEKNTAVVCFDMQNVLTCPRANVSNFFYKRKLNVFNLTAWCSINRKAYNVLWSESDAGRGANEIGSALVNILEKVIRNSPEIERLVLWSDSCVPQNRNSFMSLALKSFLQRNPGIISIEQKFCTPGHSCIQEVDNIHSHIEKQLKNVDVYSPLSLVREIKKVRESVMDIHQMKPDEFSDYQEAASKLYFKDVPYSKVKYLLYIASMPFHVYYKSAFGNETEMIEVSIKRQTRGNANCLELPVVRKLTRKQVIGDAKKNDIESMLKFMPSCDQLYMEHLLKIGRLRPT